jgi:hypothetical protein
LYVEAGWPRTPRDGIVRGGGLAAANIRHLGIKSANEGLLLAKSHTGAPAWKSIEKNYFLLEAHIRRHLVLLIDKRH